MLGGLALKDIKERVLEVSQPDKGLSHYLAD